MQVALGLDLIAISRIMYTIDQKLTGLPLKSGHTQPAESTTPAADDAPNWVRKTVWSGRKVQILVDGKPVQLFECEAIATALASAGYLTLRHSPKRGAPRGMFCIMGVCQECVVEIDGAMQPSCMTTARDGMRITTDTLNRRRESSPGISSSRQI